MISRLLVLVVFTTVAAGAAAPAGAHTALPCEEAWDYPGDGAAPAELAAWMANGALKKGLPPELPIMASLVESGLQNLPGGDGDSVGFFQMRVGIWNEGKYAGYPDEPELQLKWFLDRAKDVGKDLVADDPSVYSDWIADVEEPEVRFRHRYESQLELARALIAAGCVD